MFDTNDELKFGIPCSPIAASLQISMITFDYSLQVTQIDARRKRVQDFSKGLMASELMLGELTLVVGGVDLAWRGSVPLLDVVREIFWALNHLTEAAPSQVAQLLDYSERLVLIQPGSSLELYSEYTEGRAFCDMGKFRARATDFGVRVLRDFYERYPQAAGNDEVRRFVPIELLALVDDGAPWAPQTVSKRSRIFGNQRGIA